MRSDDLAAVLDCPHAKLCASLRLKREVLQLLKRFGFGPKEGR